MILAHCRRPRTSFARRGKTHFVLAGCMLRGAFMIGGEMRRNISSALLSFILAACAASTEVVPEGHNVYMVASHGTMGWSSGPAQKAKALQKAHDYCKHLGKEMEPISEIDSGSGSFGKTSSGEVHFRCVAPHGK